MAQHHTHDVIFDLPEGLKDNTVHMFSLSRTAPSEFNLVISRAYDVHETNVDDFAERLLGELKKALPKFEFMGRSERTIDGEPAVDLSYSWRNEGTFVQQRQVAVLMGDGEGQNTALMITATSPKPIDGHWASQFESMLESTRFRASSAPATAEANPGDGKPLPHVFALDVRSRAVHVFPNAEAASAEISSLEVGDNQWVFFESDGEPLEPAFIVRNRVGLLRSTPGRYELKPAAESAGLSLQQRLNGIQVARGLLPFETIEDIAAHLQRNDNARSV